MKAVTISKIARVIIAISVAIIIAIPVYGGLQSFQMSGTDFVEVESEYELANMTESNLKSNISNVIGDSNDYKIVYGNTIESVKASNLNVLVAKIKSSGAETATLLDADGKIATQDIIVGSNGMSQYIYTGLKLSSGLIKSVTPTVDINAKTPNGTNKISNVEFDAMEDKYNIAIELPMVAVASALYLNSSINLDVGIEYGVFFKANIQMDLPAEMFRSDDMPPMPTPVISPDKKSIELDTGIALPENIDAKVGDVSIKVTTGGSIDVKSTDASIVDSLRASLEKDGQLVLNVEGKDPITIKKDTAESLIDMLDQIIKQQVPA